MISQDVKDKAQELYLKGEKVSAISRALTEVFSSDVKIATIYSWIRKENWPALRGSLHLEANNEMAIAVKDQMISSSNMHTDMYNALWNKAGQALGLDDPDSQITFTKTSDAVKALDVGIQGERKVQQGLVNTQIIIKISNILSEEIDDEVLLRRIAVKFRSLADEVASL